jgi:hypothetical protein
LIDAGEVREATEGDLQRIEGEVAGFRSVVNTPDIIDLQRGRLAF